MEDDVDQGADGLEKPKGSRRAKRKRRRERQLAEQAKQQAKLSPAGIVDELLPAEQIGRNEDDLPHWEEQRKPPRMADYSLEMRALREGWLKGAPQNAQLAVASTFLRLMVDDKATPSTKLKAGQAYFRILASAQASIKDEAVVSAKSLELGESRYSQSGVIEGSSVDVATSAVTLLDGAETLDELEVVERLLVRKGLDPGSDDSIGRMLRVAKYKLSLLEFGKPAFEIIQGVDYIHGKHAELMCAHLEGLAKGKITRLLMNIPPSCSKSSWMNVIFPAWLWTWWPECKVQSFAYNEALSIRDQMLCRQLIGSEWYQEHFPHVQVKFGQDQKQLFVLETGGERRVGIPGGGLTTGGHPDIVLVDDVLSAKKAESAGERQAVKSWYFETMSTRGMARGAKHCLAMQRLHVDDLSGAILEKDAQLRSEHGESPWVHVMLPMRFDPARAMVDQGFGGDWRTKEGELLFPELLNEDAVEAVERELGPHGSNCQLAQDPKRRDGSLFKTTRLEAIQPDEVPPISSFDEFVRFWDLAGTDERENSDACYTAGALMGRIGQKYVILDMIRKQVGGDEVEDLMEETIIRDEAKCGFDKLKTVFEREPGSSGKRVAELICKRLRKHRISAKMPKGRKEVRAEPLSAEVGRYAVSVVVGDFYSVLLDELQQFPGSKYKDQVDALSGAYLEIENPSDGKKRIAVAPVRSESGRPPMGEMEACANPACDRPAFSGTYCCDCCEASHDADDEEPKHKPRCNGQYSDWYNKR